MRTAIEADFRGIRPIKVYAPTGIAKRNEGEHFKNAQLPFLLRKPPGTMILGGDFNCILDTVDKTGHFRNSRALADLIHGMALQDTWKEHPAKRTFTHHSQACATELIAYTCLKA
jgi:exonuclease III